MTANEIGLSLLDEGNRLFEEERFNEAAEKFQLAAEEGSTSAMVSLAWFYETGKGREVNYDMAEEFYRKAASEGGAIAQFYLGSFLYRIRKNFTESIEYIESSADQIYPPEMYRLGVFFDQGNGVEKDELKARELFEASARLGHIFSRRMVAGKMIRGLYGFKKIPAGIWSFIATILAGARDFRKDPASELIVR